MRTRTTMAQRSSTVIRSLISQSYHRFYSKPSKPSMASLVNSLARVLSDHRNQRDDLEPSLASFAPHVSTNLVEQVLKRCKNLGFSAHRFFLWAKEIPGFQHSYETHQILVDVLGSNKQFGTMWELLVDVRDSGRFPIGSEIFRVVFRAYARLNLPMEAVEAFDRMSEFGVKPSVDDLNNLLNALSGRKHARHAGEFFSKSKVDSEIEPNDETYLILIRGWGEISDAEEARKVFEEMLQRGFLPNTTAYNVYMEALCKGGKSEEAHKIFASMPKKGLSHDAESYSIFIRAHCESDDLHSAFRALDRMKRYGLKASSATYNHVIRKLGNDQRVDEAYKLVEEMTKNGVSPDTWSYNAILASHCRNFEVKRSLRLLQRMQTKKNAGLAEPDSQTYNMVLKMLIEIGRFDRMAEVWAGLGKKSFYPAGSTYTVVIHGLCRKNGKVESAAEFFEEMIEQGVPPYPLTVKLLRERLLEDRLAGRVRVIADKMEQSTCCKIREMASQMRGPKGEEPSSRLRLRWPRRRSSPRPR